MPAGKGPHPGVVVLHECFGLNGDIRRIAARLADVGYAALAPDLYSHGRRIVCLSRVIVDMLSGGVAREIADIHAAREALAARVEIDARRIAVAGFCQGGGFALVAGTRPSFQAAAVNYGTVPADRSKAGRRVSGRRELRRQGPCSRATHGRALNVGRAAGEHGVALFGHAACCFVASRTVFWGCCSAEQLVDQGAAPLGVVQERGVAS